MSEASIWLLIGIGLAFAEFAIPGLVVIFFGAGAIFTAAVVWVADVPLWVQVALFTVSSVLALVVGRRFFKLTFRGKVVQRADCTMDLDSNGMVGQVGEATTDIHPPKAGRVAVRGSDWTAIAEQPISAGAMIRVTACNNITLTVEEVKQ